MAQEPRAPQQAGVGSKTRSAGRAPLHTSKRDREANVEIVVSGRRCEVPDRFREHVEDKLAKLEKHDQRIIRMEVMLQAEKNPRQPERAVRVELTAKSRGPIIRAEASADDKMAALDLALDKMAAQMRKASDRRKVHRGRSPESVAQAMARVEPPTDAEAAEGTAAEHSVGPVAVDGDGPLVVREKSHAASPMGLEQALYEMELVGHDFYLFVDKESERPSVVYRRRGYDYGVISLDLT